MNGIQALRRCTTVGVAVAASLIFAVPSANSAPPTRTMTLAGGFSEPAGVVCPFAVSGVPNEGAGRTITEFDDGRTQMIGRGDPTLVNTETGRSIVHHSRYLLVETINEESGDILWEIQGQTFLGFLAGDQGPFGTVGPNGALLSLTGHQTITVDAESGLFTAYSLDGRVRDLCAALEG